MPARNHAFLDAEIRPVQRDPQAIWTKAVTPRGRNGPVKVFVTCKWPETIRVTQDFLLLCAGRHVTIKGDDLHFQVQNGEALYRQIAIDERWTRTYRRVYSVQQMSLKRLRRPI